MKRCLFTVIMLGISSTNLFAQDLGRLFTSVEERRVLDDLRLNQALSTTDIETPTAPLAAIPTTASPTTFPGTLTNAPSEIRFSGFIRRSDGTYAIWVNGQSALSTTNLPIEQAKFLSSPQAQLQTAGRQATMKPGQIWSLDTNTVREGYYIKRRIFDREEASQPVE